LKYHSSELSSCWSSPRFGYLDLLGELVESCCKDLGVLLCDCRGDELSDRFLGPFWSEVQPLASLLSRPDDAEAINDSSR